MKKTAPGQGAVLEANDAEVNDPRPSVQPAPDATHRRSPDLSEPVIVAEFWANRRGEAVRIQLRRFEGRAILDLRKHYTAPDGVLRPTKKWLSLVVTRLPDLAIAIGKALEQARELGLIGEGTS